MSTTGITIVTTAEEKKKFIEFPYTHYKNDPHFVPPLRMDQKKLLDTKKNSFYKNAEIVTFIAEHNGQIAGRISASIDHRFNAHHKRKTGHFGFFECIDHQPTADLLFRVAEDWLREKGMEDVLGPASPGMMDVLGFLIEGFDKDPYIMMPYNKPYYDKLVRNVGYEVDMEMLAFLMKLEDIPWDRLERAKQIVYKRVPGLSFRQVNLKKMSQEIDIVREIYTKAWSKNWGYLPLTKEEFADLADELKMILDPEIAHIAEVNGQPVGFSISLPNLNLIFKKLDGNLFPFGIFKVLLGKKKVPQVRTALMGVLPEFQGRGIEALLNQQTIELGSKKGYNEAELSWVLASNKEMIRVAERLGATVDKRYQMYSKQL